MSYALKTADDLCYLMVKPSKPFFARFEQISVLFVLICMIIFNLNGLNVVLLGITMYAKSVRAHSTDKDYNVLIYMCLLQFLTSVAIVSAKSFFRPVIRSESISFNSLNELGLTR